MFRSKASEEALPVDRNLNCLVNLQFKTRNHSTVERRLIWSLRTSTNWLTTPRRYSRFPTSFSTQTRWPRILLNLKNKSKDQMKWWCKHLQRRVSSRSASPQRNYTLITRLWWKKTSKSVVGGEGRLLDSFQLAWFHKTSFKVTPQTIRSRDRAFNPPYLKVLSDYRLWATKERFLLPTSKRTTCLTKRRLQMPLVTTAINWRLCRRRKTTLGFDWISNVHNQSKAELRQKPISFEKNLT